MFHSRERWAPAGRARLQIDIITPWVSVALPRGHMDVRFRVSAYANGSRALELQDADGVAFYVPTMPCDRETMLGLIPADEVDNIVLGIKPSAMRNGVAGALVDAGLLVDLAMEMPVDRHFVHLMRFDLQAAGMQAMAEEERAAAAVPAGLLSAKVPPAWKPGCRRIQSVFRRHGMIISEEDAFVAWILAGRMVPAVPPRLPAAGEDVFALMKDRFG